MATRKKQEPIKKEVKLIPEFKDNKELIMDLISSDRFDDAIEYINAQKKYNKFLDFSKQEKNEYGFVKGYLNIIDSRMYTWLYYIKPKLQSKLNNIECYSDVSINKKFIENLDPNNYILVQIDSYNSPAKLSSLYRLENNGIKINHNFCYDVKNDLIQSQSRSSTILERRKIGLYNNFNRNISRMDIYYTEYYKLYKENDDGYKAKYQKTEPNLFI
jgi:hypothetical protein